MQFSETWRWLLEPSPHTGKVKTVTRREVKGCDDAVYNANLHDNPDALILEVKNFLTQKPRWKVGQIKSVVLGRGQRTVWYTSSGNKIWYAHEVMPYLPHDQDLIQDQWTRLQIQIDEIMDEHEPEDIPDEAVLEEGYASKEDLLKVIGKYPSVWGIRFHVIGG